MLLRCSSLLFIAVVAACGGSSSADPDSAVVIDDAALIDANAFDAPVPDAVVPDARPLADAGIPSGAHYQYVINTITIPTTASQASQCGLNIDGDPLGRVDNAVGQVVAALGGAGGANPQPPMDQALADGSTLHLLDVQADSLVDDSFVSLRQFFGDDADMPANPSDNYSGTENFDVRSDSPTDTLVGGPINTSNLQLGPGELFVKMVAFPGSPPIIIPLAAVHMTGAITATEITDGILGGAITESDVDTIMIPAMAVSVQGAVAADCGGTSPNCCDPGSTGETIVGFFDTNSDCLVSEQEVRDNALLNSLIAPDVDLFDAGGAFNPNSDGVNDALSVGVCFTAVGAVFTLP